MITKQKRILPPSVTAYFPTDADKKVWKRVKHVAKLTGLSESKIASMAIWQGLEAVENNLLKMEVAKRK